MSQEPVLSKEQPAFQYSSHVSLQAPSGHMWWVWSTSPLLPCCSIWNILTCQNRLCSVSVLIYHLQYDDHSPCPVICVQGDVSYWTDRRLSLRCSHSSFLPGEQQRWQSAPCWLHILTASSQPHSPTPSTCKAPGTLSVLAVPGLSWIVHPLYHCLSLQQNSIRLRRGNT